MSEYRDFNDDILLSSEVKNEFGRFRRTLATKVNAIDRLDNSIL